MTEYKATGKQLEVPPDARGVPFDQWQEQRLMPSRSEIAAHMKEREAIKPKGKDPKSGALPNNTEWL